MHIATLLAFEDEMQKIAGIPKALNAIGATVTKTAPSITGHTGNIIRSAVKTPGAAGQWAAGRQMSKLHGGSASMTTGQMRQKSIQQGQQAARLGGRTGDMAQVRGHGPMQAAPQGNKYLNMQKAKMPAAPARLAA